MNDNLQDVDQSQKKSMVYMPYIDRSYWGQSVLAKAEFKVFKKPK